MPEILIIIPVEYIQLMAWPDHWDPATPLFITIPADPLDPHFQLSVLVKVEEVQQERWDTYYNGSTQ